MKNKNIISNENGLALPLALFITVVLVLLGTTLWFYGSTELLNVTRVEKNMKAHYLSRSGIEIAKEFISNNYEELLFWSSGFYLYGSLTGEDGFLLEDNRELTFKREYEGNYEEDLIIEVKWDGGVDERGESGRIISVGNNLGAKEEINLPIFIAAGGGDGEGGIGDVPEEELTDPPQDAVDAGPDGLGWHDEDGALNPGGTGSQSDQPVYFTGDPVIYEFQASGAGQRYFASPIMFFLDEPLSVDITNQNANLRLRVTFVVFKSDINFKEQGNKTGSITLNEDSNDDYEPLASNEYYGSDIKALGLELEILDDKFLVEDDVKYGLIYIGGRIKIDHSKDVSEKLKESGPGFYLFPENTDLSQEDDLGRLIKVENIGDINFGAMGILDLLIEEGIDFGGIDVGGMDGG